ncbi:HTH-type transcriptional regulator CysL [Desulfosporosinus acididurans]|uniref:HTH-type transcriptional regulator CysL n=1 Tax=Desulfosporosinus acididurans TaxID=476652 RepID=A0A0J1FKF9_9FIRM|nr:LysR family transcriptional regulator [Desulfosporosinus acididurans]KLU63969.1 HTH-type transcriptional regulator CysL [Desulfosporosinus acididurans]
MEEHLLVFKEVADSHNITSTAKKLHMSQPNITLQIKNLEHEYGAKFFNRSNKGVSLTKEGEIFYAHVRNVLDVLSNAREQIKNLSKRQKKVICVGTTLVIGEYILPSLLAFLYETHPDVEFKVKIGNTESIYQEIMERKIHIGLIEGQIDKHADLNVERFWEDELVVALPYFHPWASRTTITLEELLNERLVTREAGSETRRVMEIMLREKGIDPTRVNLSMELGSTQAIKQAVAAGLGIAIISSLTVSKESDQKIFKTLKIPNAPVCRALNILSYAHIKSADEELILINLLHNHELIGEILSMDYYEIEKQMSKKHLLASK